MFNRFVILGGVSSLLLGVGALSQALLEFELQSFFGRRRMEGEIGRLGRHYIICGRGRVGRSVARELARRSLRVSGELVNFRASFPSRAG